MVKPTCFIIQQYVENDFDALYDAIEVAAELAGYEPIRADKVLGAKPPMLKIQEQITKASVCVAEANTSNENVYFEMGYASALEKPLFILWDKNHLERLPFDISHKAAITYNSQEADWTKKLRDRLKLNLVHELSTASNAKPAAKINKLPNHEQEIEYDELALTIITALAVAETNNVEPSVSSLPKFIAGLGHDILDVTVMLKKLLKFYYINIDHSGYGDEYSSYSLKQKGYDYLENNSVQSKKIRETLPDKLHSIRAKELSRGGY